MIKLEQISIDGTQSRAALNQNVVADYAERIAEGEQFPPVVVFFDGAKFWLADGFHRFFAARKAGLESIVEDRRTGSQRDAILYSVSANAAHGLQRTNADKRKSVEMLLSDPEWSAWSDSQIAKACAVSHTFVAGIRREIQPERLRSRTAERSGTTYQLNTDNIGKRPEPAPRNDHPEFQVFGKTVEPEIENNIADEENYKPTIEEELAATLADLQIAHATIAEIGGEKTMLGIAELKRQVDYLQKENNRLMNELAFEKKHTKKLEAKLKKLGEFES